MARGGADDFDPADSARPAAGWQRREIFYSGHVQGVGFRYTTRSIAARLPIVGTVRNLPDGQVELIAEGSPPAIDDFLARIEAELGRYIRGKQEANRPATGEFSSFDVIR